MFIVGWSVSSQRAFIASLLHAFISLIARILRAVQNKLRDTPVAGMIIRQKPSTYG